jgi:hypothetical protein
MTFAVELDPGAMIYVYIKLNRDCFRYSEDDRGIHKHTDCMGIA